MFQRYNISVFGSASLNLTKAWYGEFENWVQWIFQSQKVYKRVLMAGAFHVSALFTTWEKTHVCLKISEIKFTCTCVTWEYFESSARWNYSATRVWNKCRFRIRLVIMLLSLHDFFTVFLWYIKCWNEHVVRPMLGHISCSDTEIIKSQRTKRHWHFAREFET